MFSTNGEKEKTVAPSSLLADRLLSLSRPELTAIAAKVGVHVNTLYAIRKGGADPKISTVCRLADALGLSVQLCEDDRLFELPAAAPARPRRLPAQPPRRGYAGRYGSDNPLLFAPALLAVPTPAPRPVRNVYPMDVRDAWGEWANAYDEMHGSIRDVLDQLPLDYYASAGYIRAYRPSCHNEALKFWNSPLPRAHCINALLCRGDRSVAEVHVDLGLKKDKLYEQLPRWGVVLRRLGAFANLQDGAGNNHTVHVDSRSADGWGTVTLKSHSITLRARFEPRAYQFVTSEVIDLSALVPLSAAAAVLGLTEPVAARVLPTVRVNNPERTVMVWPADMRRTIPAEHWRMPLEQAVRARACRCVFWDSSLGGCGLGNTPTLVKDCEDHEDPEN